MNWFTIFINIFLIIAAALGFVISCFSGIAWLVVVMAGILAALIFSLNAILTEQ